VSTQSVDLELGYRRWLRCYPKAFRREHEAEILGVLMADAGAGQRRPAARDCADLAINALWIRVRPRVPRSDRAGFAVVRLMYVGAAVELAVGITILATIGSLKANVVRQNPGYSAAQWHAEIATRLAPLAVGASVAVAFWLWMAWANGRGKRWTRIAFPAFFALNSFSLIQGLTQGSADYARADLVMGLVLWAVELAVISLMFHRELRRLVRL
jgi:hypothetical protein